MTVNMPAPRRVEACPATADPSVTVVTFYGPAGYSGHAVLDEDGVRRLRDELNDCLSALSSREMAARWEGSS